MPSKYLQHEAKLVIEFLTPLQSLWALSVSVYCKILRTKLCFPDSPRDKWHFMFCVSKNRKIHCITEIEGDYAIDSRKLTGSLIPAAKVETTEPFGGQ